MDYKRAASGRPLSCIGVTASLSPSVNDGGDE